MLSDFYGRDFRERFPYIGNEIPKRIPAMDKIKKGEIRKIVAEIIEGSLRAVKMSTPSNKTKESLVKLSKKLSAVLHDEIKKQAKDRKKALKKVDEEKLVRTIKKLKREDKKQKTKPQ